MANPEHLKILEQGVDVWNKWREDHPDITPQLKGLVYRKTDVRGTMAPEVLPIALGGKDLHTVTGDDMDRFMDNFINFNFENADLRFADFRKSKLKGMIFKNANLSNTKFQGCNISYSDFSGAVVNYIEYDAKMKCRLANVSGCIGSPRFVRHVMDLDYIEETQEKHPKSYWWWKQTSNCGRSWVRWAFISFCIAMLFGVIMDISRYLLSNYPSMINFVPAMKPTNMPEGWLTPYYFSIVTFTTLGFGDVVPINSAGQFLLILEVVFGYIMLGGLITLFANRIVRQSA